MDQGLATVIASFISGVFLLLSLYVGRIQYKEKSNSPARKFFLYTLFFFVGLPILILFVYSNIGEDIQHPSSNVPEVAKENRIYEPYDETPVGLFEDYEPEEKKREKPDIFEENPDPLFQ